MKKGISFSFLVTLKSSKCLGGDEDEVSGTKTQLGRKCQRTMGWPFVTSHVAGFQLRCVLAHILRVTSWTFLLFGRLTDRLKSQITVWKCSVSDT